MFDRAYDSCGYQSDTEWHCPHDVSSPFTLKACTFEAFRNQVSHTSRRVTDADLQILHILCLILIRKTLRIEREDFLPENMDFPRPWQGQDRNPPEQQLLLAI